MTGVDKRGMIPCALLLYFGIVMKGIIMKGVQKSRIGQCKRCGKIFSRETKRIRPAYCDQCLSLPVPQQKPFYVYQIAANNFPFYVGMSCHKGNQLPRMYHHEQQARGAFSGLTPTSRKIKQLLKNKKKPQYAVLGIFATKQEASEAEAYFIREYAKSYELTNIRKR